MKSDSRVPLFVSFERLGKVDDFRVDAGIISAREGAEASDGSGFDDRGDSCVLKEDRSFAEQDGVFEENGREVMWQDDNRVDKNVGKRIWLEERRIKEEIAK